MPFRTRCLIPAMTLFALAAPAHAAPAMWEVRDGDSAIWLFGSIHVLPEGLDWRTELFEEKLAEVDKIVFETDVRPAATASLVADAFIRGVYTDGTLLTDVIDEDTEQLLRDNLGAYGIPVGSVLAMRPWLAGNTITVAALAAEGYSDQGVEFQLQPDVEDARLGFLETGQEQLNVLAGAPDDEQLAMLTATLEELPKLPKIMTKMMYHWEAGTPDLLADLFLMEMGGFEDAFIERLLYQRNRNWMGPLEDMLDSNEQNLVVVGAAHMIGEHSVIDLLEQAGYTVERIQ